MNGNLSYSATAKVRFTSAVTSFLWVMKTKTQTSLVTSASPILDPNLSLKARLLWAIIRYQEEQHPESQLTIKDLTVYLKIRRRTLLEYLCELERGQCLEMQIKLSAKLLPFAPDHVAYTSAYDGYQSNGSQCN